MLSERHPRHHTFPLLSPTYCSHQLWTPLYLDRVTINQKNYHHYLKSATLSSPHAQNMGATVWTKKYGDNGFFVHKNMPIEQKYDKTLLLKSDVRSWDQIVPRPMTTSKILEKESKLPFPSQHPYTSHISQFAVFPDTKLSNRTTRPVSSQSTCSQQVDISVIDRDDGRVDAAVQTDYSCFDQTLPDVYLHHKRERAAANIVKSKAFSSGARMELLTEAGHDDDELNQQDQYALRLCPGIYRWDVTRTLPRKLQSSMTYPAPTTLYAPMDHPMAANVSFLNPITTKTLHSVNIRVATATAYSDYYSQPSRQSRQIFKRESLPLSESRGKYARLPQFSAVGGNQIVASEQFRQSFPDMSGGLIYSSLAMCNQATQTNDDDDINNDEPGYQIDIDRLQLNENVQDTHDNLVSPAESYLQPSSPGSSSVYSDHQELFIQPEYNYDNSDLDRPYSKTEALKQFNMQHPRRTPDLREFSISQGRRHIINGYHAHYWH